jgi:N-acetylglucosaminyldiphosphoundecaprenol N-acetyl-beta-D-mannosaminyltransferase
LYWIDDNREELDAMGVRIVVGVGGAFEMVAGKPKRAPRVLQLLGLEGVYRFLKQPEPFRLRRLIMSFRFLRYV